MNVFELTRALTDIESVTNSEKRVGEFLFTHLSNLVKHYPGHVERMEVEPARFNVFAHWGQPVATLSTHMDTVPPFFPSREDEGTIWGRGACDAKGIIAAMIASAEKLLAAGKRNFGLLFVVGEELNGAGALVAARSPRGSRHLINGEPTENKIALGTKGALRYEVTARGKLAHSAYPELGHSAIETLLDVLQAIRDIKLPEDELLGRSTLNIGTIKGGRAPNVIADHAQAEIMFRLVGSAAPIREALAQVLAGRAEAREQYTTSAQRLEPFPGLPTTVVSFTTDIPSFGTTWGKPFLIGPGSIHAAHTAEEHITKQQLLQAVDIYSEMVTTLTNSYVA
ncbi:MAG TPA: M20/M25/M40 family metallo-hydrolase [Candidatus Acidoferrales bacterium]|nr:M20/M25/M40 family metallo-hydrolase [Candidatus Acidoferrales bacterium]